MIEIESMAAAYPDGKTALEGLTCSFAAGKSYALLGANGAGKSTLLKALLGLVRISAGSASIGGVMVEPKNFGRIRSLAGLVFQNSDDQLFSASVEDDIAFGPANMGLSPEDAAAAADIYIKKFGIDSLRKRQPQRLSEGEKKRASLCAVLAMNPKAVLLDEPTAQLDARGKREFSAILESLPQTVLMATHDLELAQRTCSDTVILKEGRLAFAGPLCEALENASLLEDCGLI